MRTSQFLVARAEVFRLWRSARVPLEVRRGLRGSRALDISDCGCGLLKPGPGTILVGWSSGHRRLHQPVTVSILVWYALLSRRVPMTHLTCIPQLQESLARDRVLATQARVSEIRRLVYRASPEEIASYAAQHYAAPSVKAEPTVATDPSKKAVAGRTRVMLEAVLARDSLRAELRVVGVLLCCGFPPLLTQALCATWTAGRGTQA